MKAQWELETNRLLDRQHSSLAIVKTLDEMELLERVSKEEPSLAWQISALGDRCGMSVFEKACSKSTTSKCPRWAHQSIQGHLPWLLVQVDHVNGLVVFDDQMGLVVTSSYLDRKHSKDRRTSSSWTQTPSNWPNKGMSFCSTFELLRIQVNEYWESMSTILASRVGTRVLGYKPSHGELWFSSRIHSFLALNIFQKTIVSKLRHQQLFDQ